MKAIKILFISLVTAALLSACYEDKGNYDYNGLAKIVITIDDVKDVPLGDIVKIEPVITLSKEVENINLTYQWILEGDVIGTECNLNWVADRYTKEKSENLIFVVTDVDNDLSYQEAISFSVIQKYAVDGYLVLAEKGGKKQLHMLREAYEEGKQIYKPLLNLYEEENEGESIPDGSFKLHEHYCMQDNQLKNQIMVVAGDQTLEIEAPIFKKAANTLQDMFNGSVPAGLQNSVKDVFFMQQLNLINDTEGRLYSRIKSTFEFFHSDYFLSTPLSYGGEELKKIDIIPSSYGCETPFCLLYDKAKKRFLTIWDYQDEFYNSYISGQIQEMPGSPVPWPVGVPTPNSVCEDYIIHRIDAYKRGISYPEPYATRYSCIIESKATGDYYYYDFGLEKGYSDITVFWSIVDKGDDGKSVDATMEKIPDELVSLFTSSDNVVYTLPWGQNGWCTLIGKGRDLYVYNRKAALVGTGTQNLNPRLVNFAFDSEIAMMNADTYRSNSMAVTFKNGTFQVLDISAVSQALCSSIWKSEPDLDLGTPLSMFYNTVYNLNFTWRN